jgi:hypothetical protein
MAMGALLFSASTLAADCPQATVKDMKGLKGAYPQQFELNELNCTLKYSENPAIGALGTGSV